MFGKTKGDNRELLELQRIVEKLKERVFTLEQACAPIHIGEPKRNDWHYSYEGYIIDSRPKISLHDLALKLIDHCGLELKAMPPVSGQIIVTKKPKN